MWKYLVKKLWPVLFPLIHDLIVEEIRQWLEKEGI